MKKVISIVLVAVLAIAMVSLVACGNKTETTLKFGLGVVTGLSNTKDADGDTNGGGEFNITAVAVLLDAEGKIVAADLDSAAISSAWTSKGKLIATEDFRTKYEKGTEYGMSAYGKKHDGSDGKVLEWFEQADAFAKTAAGKTLDEFKALMGEDTFATGDLATAGCTISVAEFMVALEKAVANAADSAATAENKLNLAIVSSATASSKDAADDSDGLAQIEASVVAAVVDAESKVVVAKTDAVQANMPFNAKGAFTGDAAAEIKTKLEQGDNYNMATYGKKHDGSDGKVLEWYVQAEEFNKALVGKTAADFAALAGEDSYATGDLATAGCTIGIGDMIAAAEKAAA